MMRSLITIAVDDRSIHAGTFNGEIISTGDIQITQGIRSSPGPG